MAKVRKYSDDQFCILRHVVRYQSSQPWAIALAVPGLKAPERSAKNLAKKGDRQLLRSYTHQTPFVQPVYRAARGGLEQLKMNPDSRLKDPASPTGLSHNMAVLRFCFASEVKRERLFVAEAKTFWAEAGWGDLPEHVTSRPLVWEEASKCFYAVRFADSASSERIAATLATDAEKLNATEAMKQVLAKHALKLVVLCFDVARSGAIEQVLPKYPKVPIAVEVVDYAPPSPPSEKKNGSA